MDEFDNDSNIAATLAEEMAKPEIKDIGDTQIAILPARYRYEDLEKLFPVPTRPRGKIELDDEASFNAFVTAHAIGATSIYCNADYCQGRVTFEAVLNDHVGKNGAGWRDYRAIYAVKPSIEWTRWTLANRKEMPQGAFAAFLEENMKDIASVDGHPTGSDMLAMALSLEINQDARLRSSVRLQSGGVEMAFVDNEDDATMQRMKVFDRFALGMAPFLNGEAYQVTARLRYRSKNGAVTFWFELVRPDLIVQDAVKALVDRVRAATERSVYLGRPGI